MNTNPSARTYPAPFTVVCVCACYGSRDEITGSRSYWEGDFDTYFAAVDAIPDHEPDDFYYRILGDVPEVQGCALPPPPPLANGEIALAPPPTTAHPGPTPQRSRPGASGV